MNFAIRKLKTVNQRVNERQKKAAEQFDLKSLLCKEKFFKRQPFFLKICFSIGYFD